MFRIEWCSWCAGADEGDQNWTPCTPEPGVDYSDRAACEEEARMLAALTEERYAYRVVETGDEPELAPVRKTTVQRWDPRAGKWFDVELEIAS